ncbi:MAG: S4 domain-containing protein YaaA [Fusobacteriaceae bacterium]
MNIITIKTDFIKLDQFLKWVGIVDSGVDAKYFIQEGLVLVNGEPELRRGRKLYPEDKVKFQDSEYIVKKMEI